MLLAGDVGGTKEISGGLLQRGRALHAGSQDGSAQRRICQPDGDCRGVSDASQGIGRPRLLFRRRTSNGRSRENHQFAVGN